MKYEKFEVFWNGSIEKWLNNTIALDGVSNPSKISDLCAVKDTACARIYLNYTKLKELVKFTYFKDKDKKLSRYKRAAVLVYAIIQGEDPLSYKYKKKKADSYFLKQRLAFHIALSSIIQDFKVDNLENTIFFFSELGNADVGEDDFLTSVYKDLLYAEIYKNYNVLTMANVFGLLTERASILREEKYED